MAKSQKWQIGSLVDEEYKIDELIEEKKKKVCLRKKQLVEFKIDEDELLNIPAIKRGEGRSYVMEKARDHY